MSDADAGVDSEENPLPIQGDIPLKVGGFCLNAPGDWNALAWGYKEAADILAEHVLATFGGGDLIIYPIVHLYRHHLELTLKDIIRRGNELLAIKVERRGSHSLADLWKDCRTVLERAGMPVDIPELPEAVPFETCIKEFERFDPRGESFRYPETKSGTPVLPANLDSIDLPNLRIVVDRMSFFLEIIRDTIVERTGSFC
jgi:hypothetical protein